jgi:GT2 family glycosyltransferase
MTTPDNSSRPSRSGFSPAAIVRSSRKRLWLRAFRRWRERGTAYVLSRLWLRLRGKPEYDPSWIAAHDTLSVRDIEQIRGRIGGLAYRPLISVVMQVRNPPPEGFAAAIESVRQQLYPYWELCISGDGVRAADVRSLLESHDARDPRIRLQSPAGQGGGPETVNHALAMAQGEFIALFDPDDLLAPHALYLMAEEVNAVPDANLIYSDEDSVDRHGRRSDPHFRTDWNPDLFLSWNYLGRLAMVRRELVLAAGGFRLGFEGGEEYDLLLRIIERIPPVSIRHIPFLLYHRRKVDSPAASLRNETPAEASRHALRDYLARSGIAATVEPGHRLGTHRVRRALPNPPPAVSLIIPTRDRAILLKAAVESILARTDYPDFEIVVIDNQSNEPDALAYLASLTGRPRVRVLRYERPFNYSAINNFAVRQCRNPIIGLLNNDVVVISTDWLTEMVSHAIRPEVGAVGAMLYYPDDTIQHAGILVGVNGVAINCFGGFRPGTPSYFGRAELIQNYSAVTGACLVTRADVYAEVGGLNETDLTVAYNDVDYGLRVRQRGYLVTWTPYAELYHLEAATRGDDLSPAKHERFVREQEYMRARWPEVMAHDPYYNPNLSTEQKAFWLARKPRVRRPWVDAPEAIK